MLSLLLKRGEWGVKPCVYLETTVVSYLAARPSRDLVVSAHQQVTRDWWEEQRHEFELFISQLVLQEAGAGDPQAARCRRMRRAMRFT